MEYTIKTDGTYISLVGYKSHITLYEEDLEKLISFDSDEENFVDRVNSWLYDIACDEGVRDDMQYNYKNFEAAAKKVFKNLKSKFDANTTQEDIDEHQRQLKHEELVKKVLSKSSRRSIIDEYFEKIPKCYQAGPISKYARREDVVTITAYHEGKKRMEQYINDNAETLADVDGETIDALLRGVMENTRKEVNEKFDYSKWKEDHRF